MTASATAGLRLRFCTDPGEFLAAASDHLAADPVISTVVTTIAHRVLADLADGVVQPSRDWWLVVTDSAGQVVGAGMRTAQFGPFPPFLLPMPAEAATALAHTLHERGEETLAVNGALPTVELFAREIARLVGGRVDVAQHTRLHELGDLMFPAPVPGALVAATDDDLDLAAEWFAAFMADADEQAGRPRGASAYEAPERSDLLRRIRAGWPVVLGRRVGRTGAPDRRERSLRSGCRGWDRCTHRRPSAVAAGPAALSPRSPAGSRPKGPGSACSPTRRTRRRTRSTPPSATGLSWTWPTSSSSAEVGRSFARVLVARWADMFRSDW